MPDAMLPPARMRYSYESRCRVVRAVLDDATPQEAALAHGALTFTGDEVAAIVNRTSMDAPAGLMAVERTAEIIAHASRRSIADSLRELAHASR